MNRQWAKTSTRVTESDRCGGLFSCCTNDAVSFNKEYEINDEIIV
ncbi:hypothetical protein ACX9YW_00080 [Pseudoneobacillus sp. C159]